jgi:hypothetical protein
LFLLIKTIIFTILIILNLSLSAANVIGGNGGTVLGTNTNSAGGNGSDGIAFGNSNGLGGAGGVINYGTGTAGGNGFFVTSANNGGAAGGGGGAGGACPVTANGGAGGHGADGGNGLYISNILNIGAAVNLFGAGGSGGFGGHGALSYHGNGGRAGGRGGHGKYGVLLNKNVSGISLLYGIGGNGGNGGIGGWGGTRRERGGNGGNAGNAGHGIDATGYTLSAINITGIGGNGGIGGGSAGGGAGPGTTGTHGTAGNGVNSGTLTASTKITATGGNSWAFNTGFGCGIYSSTINNTAAIEANGGSGFGISASTINVNSSTDITANSTDNTSLSFANPSNRASLYIKSPNRVTSNFTTTGAVIGSFSTAVDPAVTLNLTNNSATLQNHTAYLGSTAANKFVHGVLNISAGNSAINKIILKKHSAAVWDFATGFALGDVVSNNIVTNFVSTNPLPELDQSEILPEFNTRFMLELVSSGNNLQLKIKEYVAPVIPVIPPPITTITNQPQQQEHTRLRVVAAEGITQSANSTISGAVSASTEASGGSEPGSAESGGSSSGTSDEDNNFRFGLNSNQIKARIRSFIPDINSTANHANTINLFEQKLSNTQAIRQVENYTIWFSGLYVQGENKLFLGNPASENHHYGLIAGIHYKHKPSKQIFGVAIDFGVGNSITKNDRLLKSDHHTSQISFYYDNDIAKNFKCSLHTNFMRTTDRHQRPIDDNAGKLIAICHSLSHTISTSTELSYKIRFNSDIQLTPSVGFNYAYTAQRGYREYNVGIHNMLYKPSSMNQLGIDFGIKGSFGWHIDESRKFSIMPKLNYVNYLRQGRMRQTTRNIYNGIQQVNMSGTYGKHLLSSSLALGIFNSIERTSYRLSYTNNLQKYSHSNEILLDMSMVF